MLIHVPVAYINLLCRFCNLNKFHSMKIKRTARSHRPMTTDPLTTERHLTAGVLEHCKTCTTDCYNTGTITKKLLNIYRTYLYFLLNVTCMCRDVVLSYQYPSFQTWRNLDVLRILFESGYLLAY